MRVLVAFIFGLYAIFSFCVVLLVGVQETDVEPAAFRFFGLAAFSLLFMFGLPRVIADTKPNSVHVILIVAWIAVTLEYGAGLMLPGLLASIAHFGLDIIYEGQLEMSDLP